MPCPIREWLLSGVLCLALVPTANAVQTASREKTKSARPGASPTSGIDPVLQAAIQAAPDASHLPNSNYTRLLDLGDVTVSADGRTVAVYRQAYKLFNERARPLAEVEVSYNSSYQNVKILQARTIKKDGTIVAVKPEEIRVTSPYNEYLMYDDVQAVGFSMPDIEDGCVIDYTYQMTTEPTLLPGQFWTYWGFSDFEPVALCRYAVKAPASFQFQHKAYNDPALEPTVTASSDGRTKTYLWERRNLKPVEIEPAMPPLHDVRIWMELSSLKSWQEIAQWFWSLAKPQARANDAIRATVRQLTEKAKTDEEKTRACYDWVANRTRYVGLEFGLSAFRPHPAADVHAKLYGDCKDKALLLVTMLQLAGVKAYPALLNTTDKSSIETGLPKPSAFNHCITLAEVGGKEVWLDATAETCGFGDIPPQDRGSQALVVREGKGRFETIPRYNESENGSEIRVEVALQKDGSATLKAQIALRGASAQQMRAAVRSLTPEKYKEVMLSIAQNLAPESELGEYTLPDGKEKSGPYVLSLNARVPNYAETTGNLLLVPVTFGSGQGDRRHPFTKDNRVWPIVETETSLLRSEVALSLPEGCTILDKPTDLDISCPIQKFQRNMILSADGKTLTIVSTLRQIAQRIPPADYAGVKSYFTALGKAGKARIALKPM